MIDQQIKSLQCAAIETQACYDIYWQIPSKQAAAYNMLLNKFNSLKIKVEADYNQIQLHPQIMEILNYFNQPQTSVIPQIKETNQILLLGPPSSDPSQHYNRSIQKLCSQLLNENLLEDLNDFTVEKQVIQNLYFLIQCKGLMTVVIKPCTIPVLNNYPIWFSQGLIKTLVAYQIGYLELAEIDYLTELQIKFIHQSLKYKDSKIKQKNSNSSKNEPNTLSPYNVPYFRYSEMDTQQSQSQQNFSSTQSKQRTKGMLVSNWFHFKTYSNLRPRDTQSQIKRHKAVSSSQADLQTPFSPQKQSPFNLKASVKHRWKHFSKVAEEALNLRHKHLNEQYQQYRSNPKIMNPRKGENVQPDQLKKMKLEAMQEIEKFQKNYLFDITFNTKGLVKLLGQISYVYDNQDLIQSPQFQEIIKSSKENLYQFQNIRELALLLNFCFKNQLGDENLWFAAYQHLLNTQSQIQVEDLLLILESINETNYEYLKPIFKQFENLILEEVQRNNHRITIKTLQIYRKFQPDNNNFFYSIKKQIINSLPSTNTDSVLNYLRYYGLGNEPIEDRQEILNAIMIHLYKMQKFLNKKQLLQVYYTYVRTQLGSEVLYRLIEDRVALLIDEFQLNEIEQLLIIAANQKNTTIFKYAERLIKQRLFDCNPADLVQIAVLFIENNQGTPEFIDSLEQHLIQAIYTTDDITELLWALVQKQHNSRWMEKIADACKERVPKLNVKQLTSIVWMTSDYFKRLTNKQKQESKYIDLYELIEKNLIQYFEEGEVKNRDVALVMNAYIRNIPISHDLVDLMEIYILNSTEEELQELDGWSVSQIIWGFSQIEQYQNLKEFLKFMIKVTIECIGEMNIDELFTVLRVYVHEKQETEDMIKEAIEKTNFWIDQLDLNQVYLGIHIFTNTSFINLEGINELIKKLLDRMEFLKSIKPQVDSNEGEEIDHDKEQKIRLEVEKYKYS